MKKYYYLVFTNYTQNVMYLHISSTETTRKLHIFHSDSNTTGVDSTQHSVLEETHKEGLGSFLESQESITLEAHP